MIQKVYIQSCKSTLIDKVYVLTDDDKIKQSIEEINGNVLMVNETCLNGTERICIALNKYNDLLNKATYIVNIQGDEPFVNPEHIDLAIQKMITNNNNIQYIEGSMQKTYNNNIKCSTLHYKITNISELDNKSIGKLVLDKNNMIMYCSRNCIPYNKENNETDLNKITYYAHIGLFVFDINYLKYEYMKDNTHLQLIEDIEWLKILENGYKIVSSCVDNYEISVNTNEDYRYLLNKYYK